MFYPTRNAILPDIVSRHELGTANALSSTTWSVMLALGAALGGIVAGEWGIYPAFVIDAITFLISAVFIFQIKYLHSPESNQSNITLKAGFQQYIDGLRYLKLHIDILFISLHKGAFALTASGIFQVIQVILAEKYFTIGEGGGTSLGIFYAVAGVGTGIGPILVRRFSGDRPWSLRLSLGFSYGLTILGLLITAQLSSFLIVQIGNFLRAFGGGMNWVFSTQLLLQNVPDKVRGRVFSTEFAIFTLLTAFSSAIGGWMLDQTQISISSLLGIMAICAAIPGLFWFTWIFKYMDRNKSVE